jgi:uncharacterized membrane protein
LRQIRDDFSISFLYTLVEKRYKSIVVTVYKIILSKGNIAMQQSDMSGRMQDTDPYQPKALYDAGTTQAQSPENPQDYERQHFYQQGYQSPRPATPYPPQQPPMGQYVPPVGQIQMGIPPQVSGQPQFFVAYPMQPMPPAYAPAFPFTTNSNEPSTESKLGALFSYLGGWMTGLIMLLFVRNDRFVRFHAIQSLVYFGISNILSFALIRFIAWGIYPLRGFEVLAFVILSCLTVVGWIVGVISALAGKYTKLPFAGDYAERNLPPNSQTIVK